MMFELASDSIDTVNLRAGLMSVEAGGYCSFEGWVRDHHLGRAVERLEYEAYDPLAIRQGNVVIEEALRIFNILDARAIHRTGSLRPGELAVWIGVTAVHRDAAFEACRYIIDTVKDSVPIWKHEFYADGSDIWVDPTECSCSGGKASE